MTPRVALFTNSYPDHFIKSAARLARSAGELVDHIRELVGNMACRRKMGLPGRRAALDRSWNVVLDDLCDAYDKTVAIGPQPTPTQAGADSVVSIPEKQSA